MVCRVDGRHGVHPVSTLGRQLMCPFYSSPPTFPGNAIGPDTAEVSGPIVALVVPVECTYSEARYSSAALYRTTCTGST